MAMMVAQNTCYFNWSSSFILILYYWSYGNPPPYVPRLQAAGESKLLSINKSALRPEKLPDPQISVDGTELT